MGLWKLVVTLLLAHAWLAYSSYEAVSFVDLPPCDDFLDVLGGCGDTVSAVASLVLGTVVGVPALVNLAIVAAQTAWLVVEILEFLRGRSVP